MLPTLYLSAALAGGLALVGAGLYLEGKKAGRNEVRAQVASQSEIARDAAQGAALIAAQAISQIEVKHVTVRQQLEREVLTREVFRDCRSGDPARRLLNESPGIAPERAEPAGGGGVPAAATPG